MYDSTVQIVSIILGGGVIHTANFIRNRCPTSTLLGRTLFEYWNNKLPNLKYSKKFGQTAFVLNKEGNKGKFDAKSSKGIFVRYSSIAKGYRIYNLETKRIVVTRDVRFLDEMCYRPYQDNIISTETRFGNSELDPIEDGARLNNRSTKIEMIQSVSPKEIIYKRGRRRPKSIHH